MSTPQDDPPLSFWGEMRLIATRAVQVWWLVPRRHKVALVGSALLMVVTSACATLIPLQLGRLVLGQLGQIRLDIVGHVLRLARTGLAWLILHRDGSRSSCLACLGWCRRRGGSRCKCVARVVQATIVTQDGDEARPRKAPCGRSAAARASPPASLMSRGYRVWTRTIA